ncbi:hypothetical protein [Streptomyces sp. FH025]|uniref:hypothetical protein n=1 Tax=Streptomyces sp. FH025 TaxID=2815937 RepID=UPI001A9E5D0E|nr:hypothetical protein [Streptomyces sp. FH025]MBO1414193.1 hypothetical protein [Streptomyces sp. FH025]
MARLTVEGGDLVLRLSWWERLVTGTAPVRAPLTAVEGVTLQREPWRVFRGFKERGLLIPDRLCLGVWRHPGGRDFLALSRPRAGEAVVQVDLRRPSPFARIAVRCSRAPRAVAELRAAVDRSDDATTGSGQEPAGPDGPGAGPESIGLPGGRYEVRDPGWAGEEAWR